MMIIMQKPLHALLVVLISTMTDLDPDGKVDQRTNVEYAMANSLREGRGKRCTHAAVLTWMIFVNHARNRTAHAANVQTHCRIMEYAVSVGKISRLAKVPENIAPRNVDANRVDPAISKAATISKSGSPTPILAMTRNVRAQVDPVPKSNGNSDAVTDPGRQETVAVERFEPTSPASLNLNFNEG